MQLFQCCCQVAGITHSDLGRDGAVGHDAASQDGPVGSFGDHRHQLAVDHVVDARQARQFQT